MRESYELKVLNAWFNSNRILMLETDEKIMIDYDTFKKDHGRNFDKSINEILDKKENLYSREE